MDLFLRILLCLLMLFATLSFAGTEPWAQAILQSAAAASLILFLFSRRKIYLTPLLKPLLFIFGLIIFLAALQAVAPITILDNVPLRPHTFVRLYTLEAISYFFSLAIIILLASNLFDTRRQVATAVKTFALCVFIIGIISFSFPGKGYIYFFTGVIGDIGPFLNRNHGGIFFAMGSLLALTYTVYRYFIFKSGEWSGSKQQFYICQIMWCIVALCLMLTAIFTRSRGAMLSLAAGLAMYSLLMALFLSKTSKTRFKNTATVLVITAVVAFAAYFNVEAINAFARRSSTISVDIRLEMYKTALAMLKDYPLFGVGLNAFTTTLSLYLSTPINRYVEHLHSDWLEILLGLGFIGGLAVCAGLARFLYVFFKNIANLSRRKKSLYLGLFSIIFVMATGCLVDYHFFIPANAVLLCIVLGLVAAPTFFKNRAKRIYIGIAPKIMLALIAVALLYIPINKAIAWRTMLFAKNLEPAAKLEQYENALTYYNGHRYASRLGIEYYKQSKNKRLSEEERAKYQEKAGQTAKKYLLIYPKEKELTRLFFISRQ